MGTDWGRAGRAFVTGGLSEPYKYLYQDPANQQKNAYQTAGDSAAALGTSQRDYETAQGNQALSYFSGPQAPTGPRPTTARWTGEDGKPVAQNQLPWDKQQAAYQAGKNGPVSPDQALMNMTNNRPTQQQDYFNFMGDQAHKNTNQEDLYNARKNGTDPAAAYEDQRATEQINTQLAARGRFNSGSGVRQVSDYLANAGAQRSKQLAALAGGADQSRLGMDTAYGTSARGASGEQSDYFGNVMDSSQKLAQAKADTFGHYSDRGSDQYSAGQWAKIEAQLQKSGVDAATIAQLKKDVGGGIELATKV